MKNPLILILVVFAFSLFTSNLFAQDTCEGNFDCDQDVDGSDAAVFKEDFGRSVFEDQCPICQDSPCPCSPCLPGMIFCDKTCIDPMKDRDYCGASTCLNGTTCEDGEICVAGIDFYC